MEQKRTLIIAGVAVIVIAALIFIFTRKDLTGSIVIPYVSHQVPVIDPHLPRHDPLSDQLEDVFFDGLFNAKASPSGVIYEDGLAELVSLEGRKVTFRLKENVKWHSSYKRWVKDDEVMTENLQVRTFSAADLAFTINRIRRLGTLSPDFILIQQGLVSFNFTEGENNEISYTLSSDRSVWREDDVKEIFSFKILPKESSLQASEFTEGSGPFMVVPSSESTKPLVKHPDKHSELASVGLFPAVDNSTFVSELLSGNTNLLLNTPFGAESPILEKNGDFFAKSKLSSTFFAVLFNTKRVSKERRQKFRKLINAAEIQANMYKVNTPQQRHIKDYLGQRDNYSDYVNFSVFPKTSTYVKGKIVTDYPSNADISAMTDSINIRVSLNHGFREELTELSSVINTMYKGNISVTAVDKETILAGDYDAILLPISGYRSNYLFDLYSIFMRMPDVETYQVNASTKSNAKGERVLDTDNVREGSNFFRIDASASGEMEEFYQLVYEFMASKFLYDKIAFAEMIHAKEEELALGAWLFSLPSTSYFSKQFDSSSIVMYGHASSFSTIAKWKERVEN